MKKDLTKEQIRKLLEILNKQYIDLVKWLYSNHLNILREWEKSKGNLRIEFLQ